MRGQTSLAEKLKTLGKLEELGGEDPIIVQTVTKLLSYLHRCTAGSPRALIQPTFWRPERYWRNWRDRRPLCHYPWTGTQ